MIARIWTLNYWHTHQTELFGGSNTIYHYTYIYMCVGRWGCLLRQFRQIIMNDGGHRQAYCYYTVKMYIYIYIYMYIYSKFHLLHFRYIHFHWPTYNNMTKDGFVPKTLSLNHRNSSLQHQNISCWFVSFPALISATLSLWLYLYTRILAWNG